MQQSIGARLKAVRLRLGLSVSAVHRKSGLHRWTIDKAERDGDVTVRTLRRLCDALDCEAKLTLVRRENKDAR